MDSARILEEIDLARCRAQWSSLPDLIKKYKKVHPEDQGKKKKNNETIKQ
jgi:hypothetical protein